MVHHVQYSTAPKPAFGVDGFDLYSYDMETDLFAVAIGRSVQMIGGDPGESIVLTLLSAMLWWRYDIGVDSGNTREVDGIKLMQQALSMES